MCVGVLCVYVWAFSTTFISTRQLLRFCFVARYQCCCSCNNFDRYAHVCVSVWVVICQTVVYFMQEFAAPWTFCQAAAAAAASPAPAPHAQFLHLLQFQMDFALFFYFLPGNSLRLRLRFVTFWCGLFGFGFGSICIRQISTRLGIYFVYFAVALFPLVALCPFFLGGGRGLRWQQLCSWLEQIVISCLPNTLPRLFFNTRVCGMQLLCTCCQQLVQL